MSIKNEPSPSPAPRERSQSGHPNGVRVEVPVETIVRQVTAQVIRELADQGVRIVSTAGSAVSQEPQIAAGFGGSPIRSERADMTGYRTPVLTERHVKRLHELTGAVIVPRGTVLSPKAKELLRDKNIQLCIE